eukprot:TRINITY_DN55824_c0_g1_i1.p1 TRINITY_DN55824_c0_g1~~TRINITY_DN55824_c0_g1_i1.p1  ORF type:complete len:441 (+),score=31.34 TRINITY_DN55824_c0_g1_i1:68-1324(+)
MSTKDGLGSEDLNVGHQGQKAAVPSRLPVSYTRVPKFRFSTPPPATECHEAVPNDTVPLAHPPYAFQQGGSASSSSRGGTGYANAVSSSSTTGTSQPWGQHHTGNACPPSAMPRDIVTNSSLMDPTRRPFTSAKVPEKALFPPRSTHILDSDILHSLSLALDDSVESILRPQENLTGFVWSGTIDAAKAAFIGGTWLLRYGELLPGGVAKAFDALADSAAVAANRSDPKQRHLVLELGMGRGRAALQMFLAGATVIGVELAAERYTLAVASLERLVHRAPEEFEISRRTDETLRVRRRGDNGAILEIRHGNFFNMVSEDEVRAATAIFFQVFLPPATYPRTRTFLERAHKGCWILMFEDLHKVWATGTGQCPYKALGELILSCSWAPEEGHKFLCYCMSAEESPDGETVLASINPRTR